MTNFRAKISSRIKKAEDEGFDVDFMEGFKRGLQNMREEQKVENKFNPQESVVEYGKSGKWYVNYSSIFDSMPYDTGAIMDAVDVAGGENIKTEKMYGWNNQPEVVTFDYSGNPKDIEKVVDLKLGRQNSFGVNVRDRQYDWGQAVKEISPESADELLDVPINPEVKGVKAMTNFRARIAARIKDPDAALKKVVEQTYYKYGNGVQVNIMDIGKIFAEGVAALKAGLNIDEEMQKIIAKYRQN